MSVRGIGLRLQLWAARLSPVFPVVFAGVYLFVSDTTTWGEWLTIWPPVGWGVLFFVRALMVWLGGHRRLAVATAVLAFAFVIVTSELSSLLRVPDPDRSARFASRRARPA